MAINSDPDNPANMQGLSNNALKYLVEKRDERYEDAERNKRNKSLIRPDRSDSGGLTENVKQLVESGTETLTLRVSGPQGKTRQDFINLIIGARRGIDQARGKHDLKTIKFESELLKRELNPSQGKFHLGKRTLDLSQKIDEKTDYNIKKSELTTMSVDEFMTLSNKLIAKYEVESKRDSGRPYGLSSKNMNFDLFLGKANKEPKTDLAKAVYHARMDVLQNSGTFQEQLKNNKPKLLEKFTDESVCNNPANIALIDPTRSRAERSVSSGFKKAQIAIDARMFNLLDKDGYANRINEMAGKSPIPLNIINATEDQQKEICKVLSDENKGNVKFEGSKLNNPELVETHEKSAKAVVGRGLAKAKEHNKGPQHAPKQVKELNPAPSLGSSTA